MGPLPCTLSAVISGGTVRAASSSTFVAHLSSSALMVGVILLSSAPVDE